jgi:dihydrodipicolinate synthase/N-acetylneuraminate lyase
MSNFAVCSLRDFVYKGARFMNDELLIAASRKQLLQHLFPEGIPRLWCPALTHYDRDGALDRVRITAHLRRTAAHVKGFLIPGSTSDGWELDDQEVLEWVDLALESAREMNFHLLIGALKPRMDEALGLITQIAHSAKYRALAGSRVCGFAVCGPRGENLSQVEIGNALAAVFDSGVPVAFYQLPQVTQNEAGPELASDWARRFANFILFKDSSGADRVVGSGISLGGVFTMRGAEGDYCRWLKGAGGPYDGLLLSTANCFAAEFSQMLGAIAENDVESARHLSERLTAVINEVFGLVSGLPEGNPYANANKAIDHFFAYGRRAGDVPAPRLHSGHPLPSDVVAETGKVLVRHEFMPPVGYL